MIFQSTFKKQVCFLDTLRQEFLNLFSYLNHYTYDKLQTTRWQMKLMIIWKLLKKFGDKNSFLSLLISFSIAQLINCSMLLSSLEVTKENNYFYFKCFCATIFFLNLKVCSNFLMSNRINLRDVIYGIYNIITIYRSLMFCFCSTHSSNFKYFQLCSELSEYQLIEWKIEIWKLCFSILWNAVFTDVMYEMFKIIRSLK